jgi:hypothetical protein
MNISRKIEQLVLWVMLIVVGVAYTGKALHTHTDEYYNSLRTTKAAAANGMSDDCPICHFNLLLFIVDNRQAIFVGIVLLTVFVTAQTILRKSEVIRHFSLRAPPVML